MILLLIISIVLIWMHISSLRFIIVASNNKSVIEDAKKVEDLIPKQEKNFSLKSTPVLMSIGLMLLFNLVEIGYFIFCVYIFNDFIITLGSSILVGYAIYSIIKFFPKVKKFFSKPVDYLTTNTEGLEKLLNIVMASMEILICTYIFFKIFMKYEIF